jgi:hypothetical protein
MRQLRQRWYRLSLRTQLLIGLTLVSALLLSILGWWTSDRGRSVVEHCRSQLLQNSANYLADKLASDLNQRSREIGLIANIPQLRDPNAPVAAKRALLDELKRAYPLYAWIGLTDLEGNIIAGSEGLLEGKSVAKRAWFLEGLQGPHVGDVHDAVLLAKILPKPKIDPLPLRLADIASPVHDADGRPIGVLCGHLSWDWSYMVRDALMKGTGFGHSDHVDIFVLNKMGNILVGTPEEPPSARVLNFESVQLAMLGDTGSRVETWPDGRRYVTAFAQTKTAKGWPNPEWINPRPRAGRGSLCGRRPAQPHHFGRLRRGIRPVPAAAHPAGSADHRPARAHLEPCPGHRERRQHPRPAQGRWHARGHAPDRRPRHHAALARPPAGRTEPSRQGLRA